MAFCQAISLLVGRASCPHFSSRLLPSNSSPPLRGSSSLIHYLDVNRKSVSVWWSSPRLLENDLLFYDSLMNEKSVFVRVLPTDTTQLSASKWCNRPETRFVTMLQVGCRLLTPVCIRSAGTESLIYRVANPPTGSRILLLWRVKKRYKHCIKHTYHVCVSLLLTQSNNQHSSQKLGML